MSYPFADRTAEHERLLQQGEGFDHFTRRLLAEAGLTTGMRVLDLGSGAGNVARIAAGLVGPEGSVLGIEQDPAAVELARRRTDAPNVEFQVGDVQKLEGVEGGFDAVVGRLVLLYLPDIVAGVRRAVSLVRPGGIACFEEGEFAYQWASPQTPLWDRVRGYLLTTFEQAGLPVSLGPGLYRLFREAGLPGPRLLCEMQAAGGPEAPAWGWANVVIGLAPLMERLGVVTVDELGPDTLTDRLLAEITAVDGCVMFPPMTGAWITVPPA